MEEKFSFHAADEVYRRFGPGIEKKGAELRHHYLKMVGFFLKRLGVKG